MRPPKPLRHERRLSERMKKVTHRPSIRAIPPAPIMAPSQTFSSVPARPVAPGEIRLRHSPSDAELMALPLLEPTTLEISDAETLKLRRRLYALNRDNVKFRYRTMREAGLTMLWRLIRY